MRGQGYFCGRLLEAMPESVREAVRGGVIRTADTEHALGWSRGNPDTGAMARTLDSDEYQGLSLGFEIKGEERTKPVSTRRKMLTGRLSHSQI